RWPKPARPKWMDEATYATLPEFLEVREVRVRVDEPGCRVRQFVVATTLLDADQYSAAAVADLYHRRWHVEIFHPDYRPSNGLYVASRAA
ncbi:MAG TPA: hypothetical protein VG013_34165, partial [Gemmataceae bacterium]|nr:hypothetical protein [Gemmataceae bacterium]